MCMGRWFPQLADSLSVAACVAVRSGVLGTSLVLQASPPTVELCVRIPVMSGSSVFQEHFGILVPGPTGRGREPRGAGSSNTNGSPSSILFAGVLIDTPDSEGFCCLKINLNQV